MCESHLAGPGKGQEVMVTMHDPVARGSRLAVIT
jgi:hypothetical protein